MTRTRRFSERDDAPRRLLAMMVGLLPPAQRDWGQAMSAELDGIVPQGDRWSFALGGGATVLRQFTVIRSLTYTVIMEAAIVGALVWSMGFSYEPLRWGVVAIVLALAAVITLGRLPGPLGPVAGNKTARLLRIIGYLVMAVVTAGFLAFLRSRDYAGEDARYAMPFGGLVLLCYLVGFVAATAGRSIATERALRWGVASGITTPLLWLICVFAFGQVPADSGLAIVMVLVAVAVAVCANERQPAQAGIAALAAGTLSTLLIVVELSVLAAYAPASMIPDLMPPNAADHLAESRTELQDPYVALFVIGALIALALSIVSITARRGLQPSPKAGRMTSSRIAAGSRHCSGSS